MKNVLGDLKCLPPTIGVKVWRLESADIENIATLLLGVVRGGWVRKGDNHARIAGKLGSAAQKLEAEFRALSDATKGIRTANSADAAVRAATFYHLRFENIHPLCEGNGRIGRVILALQLQDAYNIPAQETLQALMDYQMDYRAAFAAPTPALMFELLLELFARINGIALSPDAMALPASIEPLYRQKVISKNAPPRMGSAPFKRHG